MLASDEEDYQTCRSAIDSNQPLPPKVYPNFSGCFEVLVLMGDPTILGIATIPEKIFHMPCINPYIVLASCLEVPTEVYHSIDHSSMNLEQRLASIRNSFNKKITVYA